MLAASLLILFGSLQAADSIPGWRFDNGSGTYAAALDSAVHHAGTRGVRIETLSATPIGVGNLSQSIQAGRLGGKRVRLSVWVRTRDLMGGVQLWLRADARSIMRLDKESPIPEALLNDRLARSQKFPSAPVNFDFERPE